MSTDVLPAIQLKKKYAIDARLVFDTGWRIGSGKEGETMSDLGVVLDAQGAPLLPGSSIKGKLRSTVESLAHALNLSACMLNSAVSGVICSSDVNGFTRKGESEDSSLHEQYRAALQRGPKEQLAWIENHTCAVCKLFGSPLRTARLRCVDGKLASQEKPVVQVRDGVVLDRDSHQAVDGLKYDYEVVGAGTSFAVRFELENPSDEDLVLLGAGLFEWAAGSSLGGFTSRGLGRFTLHDIQVRWADLSDAQHRLAFLTKRSAVEKYPGSGTLESVFGPLIAARVGG